MKVKETRRIHTDTIRNLCIKHNWFTVGTNEEYQELLDYGDYPYITAEHIAEMALMINKHTCCSDYCGQINEIAFEISRNCYSIFDIEENNED